MGGIKSAFGKFDKNRPVIYVCFSIILLFLSCCIVAITFKHINSVVNNDVIETDITKSTFKLARKIALARNYIMPHPTEFLTGRDFLEIPKGMFAPPVKRGYISSLFGYRARFKRNHYGIDIAAPHGDPIFASYPGVVTRSGWWGNYGKIVEVTNSDGISIRYGHCSSLLVMKGQQVNAGDIIGLVGSTGHSTGPHVHFEVRVNGNVLNPYKYIYWQAKD